MFFKSTREDPPQEETQEARIVENAVKKKKSRQKFMTLAGKVVKEVLGGGGNNATEIPVPKPKGQKMRVSAFTLSPSILLQIASWTDFCSLIDRRTGEEALGARCSRRNAPAIVTVRVFLVVEEQVGHPSPRMPLSSRHSLLHCPIQAPTGEWRV